MAAVCGDAGAHGGDVLTWPLDEPLVAQASQVGAVDALIAKLRPADSPRLAGQDTDHVRALSQADSLPPIIVQQSTMRVIDGMHRLRAAQLRGEKRIAVRFFEGSDDLAFVLAVHANTAHGLPLTLAEREAAAARIIRSHPNWSDRAIGEVSGLAAKTVASIRHCTNGAVPEPRKRVGRDGRERPLNSAQGRMLASEVIAQQPEASLRQIATLAGISLGTARDVRARVRRGLDPVPARQRTSAQRAPRSINGAEAKVQSASERAGLLRKLRNDPSLRCTESGRAVLRWLNEYLAGMADLESKVEALPPHCAYLLVELASGIAGEWLGLAEKLRQRTDATA